jgi:two-component system, OmpR family, response regulator
MWSPVNDLSSSLPSALIVDDEKDICYLLNTILRQKNISSNHAGSLAEAEKLLEKQSPSMIFLDNHLPDGFGIDNISRIKKNNPLTKIVMISAHDNPAERQKAYEEGADFFISKPFKKEIIFWALEQFHRNISVE